MSRKFLSEANERFGGRRIRDRITVAPAFAGVLREKRTGWKPVPPQFLPGMTRGTIVIEVTSDRHSDAADFASLLIQTSATSLSVAKPTTGNTLLSASFANLVRH